VTETAELKAAEVESLAKNFFGNLTAEIDRMKRGTLNGTYTGPYREEMEKRLEVDFAWKVLSGDLLEERGAIPKRRRLLGTANRSRSNPLVDGSLRRRRCPGRLWKKFYRNGSRRNLSFVGRIRPFIIGAGGNRIRLALPVKNPPSSITNLTACTRPQSRPWR